VRGAVRALQVCQLPRVSLDATTLMRHRKKKKKKK
jgi:hypothetical protein